jgi:hypothetical protein
VEARVLTREPSLLQPSKLQLLNKQLHKEIRWIQRKETQAWIHRSVGHTLKPRSNKGGLSIVDVPSYSDKQKSTANADPVTWEGPRETISDPKQMAKHVCITNAKQYHQAYNSPRAQHQLTNTLLNRKQ